MTTRERILFTLAIADSKGNTPIDVASGSRNIHRYGNVFSYFPPEYSQRNFYAFVGRLEHEKLVDRSDLNGKRYLRLTNEGMTALSAEYGHMGLFNRAWDGKWRLVFYDVVEKQRYIRHKFRSILRRFGFGMLQESLYISPHDVMGQVKAQFAQEGLLDMAVALTAQQEEFGDARALARRVWKLDQLQEFYSGLARRLQLVIGQQLPEKRESGLRRLKSEFIAIAASDPFLPDELLPAEYSFFRTRDALAGIK